jgi:hypothetical protein
LCNFARVPQIFSTSKEMYNVQYMGMLDEKKEREKKVQKKGQ